MKTISENRTHLTTINNVLQQYGYELQNQYLRNTMNQFTIKKHIRDNMRYVDYVRHVPNPLITIEYTLRVIGLLNSGEWALTIMDRTDVAIFSTHPKQRPEIGLKLMTEQTLWFENGVIEKRRDWEDTENNWSVSSAAVHVVEIAAAAIIQKAIAEGTKKVLP